MRKSDKSKLHSVLLLLLLMMMMMILFRKLNNLCYLPVEVAARALPRAPLAGLQEQREARAHERAPREHHRGSARFLLPGWASPGFLSRACPLSELRDDRNPVNGAVRVRHAAKRDSHYHCLHARALFIFLLYLDCDFKNKNKKTLSKLHDTELDEQINNPGITSLYSACMQIT